MSNVFIYALCEPDTLEIRYIGKTKDIAERFKDHMKNLNSFTHKINWIKKLLRENKKPTIKIIEEVPEENWQDYEKKWIKYYRELGYNLTNSTDGGEGLNNPSQDVRNRMSHNGRGGWKKGKKFSEEHCKNISLSRQNAPPSHTTRHSEESIIKMSESKIGNSYRKNSKTSPEALQNIIQSHCKFIYVLNDPEGNVKIVDNIRKFCRDNNLCDVGMYDIVSGKYKQYLGWTFIRKETKDK